MERKQPVNRRKWIKYDHIPKFTDPAEAVFEVKLGNGLVIRDCYYAMFKAKKAKPGLGYTTFHTSQDAPITRLAITHFRRQ